jgi:uncharacterized phosphosugar-binding protein
MQVDSHAYLGALRPVLDRVAGTQREGVERAADLMVESLREDGVVHAFGTGHSESLAMEVAGRAGGLVPTNKIALRDIVVFGGDPPSVLFDDKLEREPHVAHRLYDLAQPRPADMFVLASNSGVNGCIVEFARLVKEHGHAVVVITSLAHSRGVPSRHPSGLRLADLGDVVLDNGAPYGDALLELPSGARVCAVSSITAALLAQMMVAEVIGRMAEGAEAPPVYRSANVPAGDAHNRDLEARYAGRVRRTA